MMGSKIAKLLVLLLSLQTLLPVQKADAGFFIGYGLGVGGFGASVGASMGFVYGYVNSAEIDCYYCETDPFLRHVASGFIYGTVGFVLGTDGQLNLDQVTEFYREQFPFVDSRETLSKLSSATQTQFEARDASRPFVEIKFTLPELAHIFVDSDLSAEEFDFVAKKFQ